MMIIDSGLLYGPPCTVCTKPQRREAVTIGKCKTRHVTQSIAHE